LRIRSHKNSLSSNQDLLAIESLKELVEIAREKKMKLRKDLMKN